MADENYEYNPDIVTVSDDDGNEHVFEVLDRIEDDDDKRYVALTPSYNINDPESLLEESAELIVLRVEEDEDGETYLYPIEDEDEFDRISGIFEDRLSGFYDIEDEDGIES